MRSLHFGHLRRDSMLSRVSNVWWSWLHREVIATAEACPTKNHKTVLKQKQTSKLSECTEINQEVMILFVGPFQKSIKETKNVYFQEFIYRGSLNERFRENKQRRESKTI